ncbi:MAG: GNAT family N-acetyltransferase [Anaerolineales bacterium]|nr:GNAT family N-acetyltransferase [Anaerolineales bacterium]
MTSQLPLIEVSGKPYEMGYAYGAGCRVQIEHAVTTFKGILDRMKVPLDVATAHALRSLPICREHAPDLVAEVEGVGDGSGLGFERVFALNASLDLYAAGARFKDAPPPECWALAAGSPLTAGGRTLVAWTAEDDARWLDACLLMRVLPEEGPPMLMWNIAGTIGRPGISPHLGLAAVARTTTDFGDGLPYPFVCRRILAQSSVRDAVRAITDAPRMSGLGYVMGDDRGALAVVESSARTQRVIAEREGWLACTGLVNDGGSAKLSALVDYSEGSVPDLRLRRLRTLLEARRGWVTLADLQRAQRDHAPGDLCAHEGKGWGAACLSTTITDVGAARLWVARGNPCQDGYTEYNLYPDLESAVDAVWARRLRDGRMVWLRHVRPSDADLFMTFFPSLGAQSRDYMHGWDAPQSCTPEHAAKLAGRASAQDHVAVAVLAHGPAGDRMIGYCWIDGLVEGTMPMLGIGISDDYHEVGLGRVLLHTLLDEAGARGFPNVILGVWEDNPRARHVYELVGFRPYPERLPGDFNGRKELYMVAPTAR